jgi:hypothetical protein
MAKLKSLSAAYCSQNRRASEAHANSSAAGDFMANLPFVMRNVASVVVRLSQIHLGGNLLR